MVVWFIPAGIIAGVVTLIAGGAAAYSSHNENLSQEKQQQAILDSALSEQAKQSALEALYGKDGDVVIGWNPTGGTDNDQRTNVNGDNNSTNANPTVTEPVQTGSGVPSWVGTLAVPALVCGLGVVLALRGSKK